MTARESSTRALMTVTTALNTPQHFKQARTMKLITNVLQCQDERYPIRSLSKMVTHLNWLNSLIILLNPFKRFRQLQSLLTCARKIADGVEMQMTFGRRMQRLSDRDAKGIEIRASWEPGRIFVLLSSRRPGNQHDWQSWSVCAAYT